jgi:hypothetical protein
MTVSLKQAALNGTIKGKEIELSVQFSQVAFLVAVLIST